MTPRCSRRARVHPRVLLALAFVSISARAPIHSAAQDSTASLIHSVDQAVQARDQAVLAYTVREHYIMFRGHDEQHPAAEMTVQTSYHKGVGKTYTILSESGSAILRKVFASILENEEKINQPANRSAALLNSRNYAMTPRKEETVDGRDCIAIDLKPRHASPFLIRGTLWVDKTNGAIVQLAGTTSKSPSIFTGPSKVFRQYATISGVAMATHARAESDSWMVGQTVISIDYSGYQIQTSPTP